MTDCDTNKKDVLDRNGGDVEIPATCRELPSSPEFAHSKRRRTIGTVLSCEMAF